MLFLNMARYLDVPGERTLTDILFFSQKMMVKPGDGHSVKVCIHDPSDDVPLVLTYKRNMYEQVLLPDAIPKEKTIL